MKGMERNCRTSSVAGLVLALAVCGCRGPWGPVVPEGVNYMTHYLPYVESVDVPALVKAGDELEVTVHISTAAGPKLEADTGYTLRTLQGYTDYLKPQQPGLAAGTEIRYIYIDQGAATLPPVSREVKLSMEFGSAGTYLIYLAAAQDRESAGSPQSFPYNLSVPRFDAAPTSFGYHAVTIEVTE